MPKRFSGCPRWLKNRATEERPADHKWFTRLCLRDYCRCAKVLGLKYPKLRDEQLAELQKGEKGVTQRKVKAVHDAPIRKRSRDS